MTMTTPEAQKEFVARLYLWAKDEIQKQANEGFPLLKQLELCGRAHRLAEYIRPLSTDDRITLLTAYLKRGMKAAAESFGEPYSQEDAALVEAFIQSPHEPSHRELDLTQRQIEGEKGVLADRKILRAALGEELKPVLGTRIFKRGQATWIYTAEINGWFVNTSIDTGGHHHQLSYDHYIADHEVTTWSDHPNLNEFSISVLTRLGIRGTAMWSSLTPFDVPETAKSIASFCSYFMGIAPKLLSGIKS